MIKSFSLLVYLIFIVSYSKAQVTWFNKGQEFKYYVQAGWGLDDYGIHNYIVGEDTIINGLTLKKIIHYHIINYQDIYYLYQENDKIYNYNTYFKKKTLIYDFSLKVGDSTSLKGYIVKSIGIDKFNGKDFRYQIWTNVTNDESLVIEGIGMVGSPDFNNLYSCSPLISYYGCTGFVDGYDYFFRCFSDGNYMFDPFNTCTNSSIILNSSIENAIYPNPNLGIFSIDKNIDIDILEIRNLLGNTKKIVVNNNEKIDLKDTFPDGIYFVSGYKEQNRIFVEKMILNKSY